MLSSLFIGNIFELIFGKSVVGTAALLGGIGGLAGGVAGALEPGTEGKQVAGPGAGELAGLAGRDDLFQQLLGLGGAGPGLQEVQSALSGSRNLQQQFLQASQTGGLPTRQDISTSQGIAGQLFAPQQVALQQNFRRQGIEAGRQAGRLGRSVADPILQARLRQGQLQAQERLGASQGAFAQRFALGLPERRLGFATQANQIGQGLATQAFSNRASLLGLGNQIASADRNLRLGEAKVTTPDKPGGGFGGFLSGGLAGAGTGLGAGAAINDSNAFVQRANAERDFFNRAAQQKPRAPQPDQQFSQRSNRQLDLSQLGSGVGLLGR